MQIDELDTPVLIADMDVLEANVGRMADLAADGGVDLRPHIKTHKNPAIAHLQLRAGAVGVTCAKLGEAEVMAQAGIEDILVAYPIWGRAKIDRLLALHRRCRVRVSLDATEIARGLSEAFADQKRVDWSFTVCWPTPVTPIRSRTYRLWPRLAGRRANR
jgi:D-serine deaminase-like pyridoxal phosphate-dependent protein